MAASDKEWLIINLDKQQYLEASKEIYDYDTAQAFTLLWDLLATPLEPPQLVETPARRKHTAAPSSKCGILDMPPEMLNAVFHQIDNAQDAICFSLTNKLLATVGREHVYALFKKYTGCWRGDRILWISKLVPLEDAKELFVVDSEKVCIDAFIRNYRGIRQPVRIYQFVEATFEKIDTQARAFVGYACRRRLHGKDGEMFDKWAMANYPSPSSDEWVMCNHSRDEIVLFEEVTPVNELAIDVKTDAKGLLLTDGVLDGVHWRKFLGKEIVPTYCAILGGDRFEITTTSGMPARKWRDVNKVL